MIIVKYLLIIYRKVSRIFFRNQCRYYPSCSHFAEQAIEKHGLLYGSLLAIKRLIKCNQFFPGGFDPVP